MTGFVGEEQCRARALDGLDMAADASADHVLSAAPRDEEITPASDELPDTHDPNHEIPPPANESRAPASPSADTSDENDDTEPIIGKALARKIAAMPASERDAYRDRLRRMHPTLVERECNMARNNLMMKRLLKGMSGEAIMALGSDDEEDEGEGDKSGGEGGGEGSDEGENEEIAKKQAPRKKKAPSNASSRQTRARAAAAAPVADPTPPPSPQVPRPCPTPTWRGAPQGPPVPPSASGEVEAPPLPSMSGASLGGGAETPAGEDTSALGARGGVETTPAARNESAEQGGAEQGGVEAESTGMWEQEEREGWPVELGKGFTAFGRGKSWGGSEWESCVRLLIALEQAWGFPGKGLLSAPDDKNERPMEVPVFLRGKREWDATVEILGALGPRDTKESYASRWWSWWSAAQPPARVEADVWKAPADVDLEDWKGIAGMHGRNGMLLYLGGLLWWGEAAVADKSESATRLAEWQEAVKDVGAVLKEALKVVGPMR